MLTLLAWSPVILLFILAVFFRRSALFLSVAGLAWTVVLAASSFKTSPGETLAAVLQGVMITLPLLLVVYGGILLASVLIESGSLGRLADWFTAAARDEMERITLLAMGMGNSLEGAGIIAEPVAAPMLRASGLPSVAAAALSIIGYSGLMTLGLGGVIITVLSAVSGYDTHLLAGQVAILSIPAAVMLAWSVPLFAGRREAWRKLPYLTVMGLVSGAAAWLGVRFLGYQVGELVGGVVLTAVIVLPRWRRLKLDTGIARDALPLMVMGAGIVAVNTLPGLKELATEQLVFGRFKPLADAYTWLILAFLLAHRLHFRDKGLAGALLRGSMQGWRPLAAMAFFGAMGQVMAATGSVAGPAYSIPVLLSGSLKIVGPVFPALVPFLGWVGTFLTGYGVASIMLFTSLLMEMAGGTGMPPVVLVSGLAVGASVGGVSSPFKVAFAASMCGAAGKEGDILRITIPLGIVVCLGLGVVIILM
jgi:lactate permease